jgi:hypothetical protein
MLDLVAPSYPRTRFFLLGLGLSGLVLHIWEGILASAMPVAHCIGLDYLSVSL